MTNYIDPSRHPLTNKFKQIKVSMRVYLKLKDLKDQQEDHNPNQSWTSFFDDLVVWIKERT